MKHRVRASGSALGHRGVITALNVILATAAVAAVAAIVLEYGFRTPPVPRAILRIAETVIVVIFVLDRILRLLLARRRGSYLRDNWIDFALMGAAGVAVAVSVRFHGKVVSAGALYVAITQAYILVSLIIRGVNVNLRFAGSGIHPTWLLIGSFAVLIAAGTGLLMLDRAVPPGRPGTSFVNALFTATSATCVTGLVVRDTGADFSPFGQAVILFLIQSGGLGIMLFGTVFALLIGKALSVRHTSALGHMLATDRTGQLRRTAVFVVIITFAVEAGGAALFYPMFSPSLTAAPDATGRIMTAGRAVWNSVFHSISSFCNAGFSLYGRNMFQGVSEGWREPLRGHWQILGVMAPLIVLGGLGFPVLQDCGRYVRDGMRRLLGRLRRSRARPGVRPRLSLHSKVVLATSLVLVVLGAAVLLGIEPDPTPKRIPSIRIGKHAAVDEPPVEILEGDWTHLPQRRRVREAVFQSITARTAGFNTIDMAELSDAGKLWMCSLMIIGGSPASTAGGMKTVTFALLVLTAYCVIRRRNELEVFKRSIPLEILRKAVTLAVLYLGLVLAVTLLLSMVMKRVHGFGFLDMLFEACSACGTVGLSTGVTSRLTGFGKYVIVAGMFVGRLGPLTLLVALTSRLRHVRYAYPTENVVIG